MTNIPQPPLISICIPVFNGAPFLRKAIQSASNQTLQNIEILIIDDQSSDNSTAIISEYAKTDSRIRFFRNINRLGLVGNWNRCIELAKGEWIKFLFQDDLLEPDCLEKMIYYQNKSPRKEKVLFCKRAFIFENDCSKEIRQGFNNINFYWDIFPNKLNLAPKDITMIITRYPGRNIFGEPTSFLLHSSIFKKIGFFDKNYYHFCDIEYWLRAGVNMPLLFIPVTLAHFRVHNRSTTNFNRTKRWVQMRHIDRIKLFDKFLNDDSYSPLRRAINTWPCRLFLKTQTAIFVRRARIDIASGDKNQKKEFYDYCVKNDNITILLKQKYYSLAIKYILSKLCLELKFTINNRITSP